MRTATDIKTLVLHHSATVDGVGTSINAIRRYHIDVHKWIDLGYHGVIELVGSEFELFCGRPWHLVGAHAPGHNADSLGICLVGNFDTDHIPVMQWNKALEVCRDLMIVFNIDRSKVLGHREATPQRTCPGAHFDLDEFRRSL